MKKWLVNIVCFSGWCRTVVVIAPTHDRAISSLNLHPDEYVAFCHEVLE